MLYKETRPVRSQTPQIAQQIGVGSQSNLGKDLQDFLTRMKVLVSLHSSNFYHLIFK